MFKMFAKKCFPLRIQNRISRMSKIVAQNTSKVERDREERKWKDGGGGRDEERKNDQVSD